MPIYNVKAPDGKTYKVQGPENADEGALIETLHNYLSTAKAPAPQPSTNRTALEAVTDVPAALLKGAAGMAQLPGQVYGLATGDFDTAAMRGPQKAQDFAESLKSQGLKAREAQQASIIAEAAKNGVISEGVAAVASTIKDPALFVSFIAEQVPQLLPALLTGGAYTALSTGARQVAKYGTKKAAEAAARAGAARVALGTGIAQQGADVGTDTYKEALDLAEKQYPGMSLEDRQALALSKARATAGEAGIISLLAQRLPGGRAIERRMAGLPGEGRIRSALGEAASEMIEEGGGKFASNVNLQQIDPTRSLTQGVGQAAGLGAIGGGVLGGAIGQSAPAEPLQPGQRQGESLEQTTIRLQQEILNAQNAINNLQQGTQDPSVQIAQANNELAELAANNKPLAIADQIRASQAPAGQAPAVEPFVEPAQPFAAAEPTVAAAPVVEPAAPVIEPAAPVVEPAAPVVEPAAPVAVPEQPAAVSLPEVPGNVSNVSGVNQFTQPIQGEQDVTKPVAQPSGGSPAAVVESAANAPAPSAGGVDRSGVVPAGQDVGVTVSGEGNAPAAVKAPSYEPLLKLPDVVSTFKTERGSTYALHSDNTTTRNRSGVDSPDTTTGLQQRSAKTVFLTPENVDVIGGVFQNADIATELVPEVKNGKPTGELQLKLTEDYGPKKAGEVLYTVPYQTTPSVGLSPVEVYSQASPKGDDGRGIHFGTAITEVNATDKAPTKTVPTEEAPATQTVEAPQEPGQEEVTALNEEAQVVLDKINQAIEGAVAPDAPKGYTFNLQGKSFRVPGSQPALLKFKNTTLLKEFPNIFKAGPVVPPAQPKAESLRQKAEATPEAPKETLAELEQQKAENTKNIEAEIAEKKEQLTQVLKAILTRMGLKDVAVNLIEDIKSEEEGSYADRLMRIAVDANDPLRVLKHETVHALKELGFFTDSQWKSLTSQANSKWIDKYLKGTNVELDGKTMSRYDAYMVKYNGNMDMIVEEAIADAFGDFSVKAPPGMLAALTARMKMLFQGIKSALNGTGFYTSDQIADRIFTKTAKGQLKAPKQTANQAAEPIKLSLSNKSVDFNNLPKYLYHATYRPLLESIKKNGLGGSGAVKKWEDSKPGTVYFDKDPEVAKSHAEASELVPEEWLDEIVVLKIPTDSLDKSKLNIDSNIIDNKGDTLEYQGVVPFNKIVTKLSLRAPKTEAFKNWFGDSKITNKDGTPTVVYHGTKKDFSVFETKYPDGLFFFSTNPAFASKWPVGTGGKGDLREPPAGTEQEYKNIRKTEDSLYSQYMKPSDEYNFDTEEGVKQFDADRAALKAAVKKETGYSSAIEFEQNAGVNVMPVYLSIQKPFDPRTDYSKIEKFLAKEGKQNLVDKEYHKSGNWVIYEDKGVIDELKRQGYDGIWLAENIGGPHETIAAFSNTQIKSATGNVGTYSKTNPDIRYSLRSKWSDERIDSLIDQYSYFQTGREGDTKAYATFVKPSDFLNATATKEYRKELEKERTPLDVKKLAKQSQPIYLDVRKDEEGVYQIVGHEGRHRMMALRDEGVDTGVPVVLNIRPSEAVKNAAIVDEPYFKPQKFGDGSAPKGFFTQEMIPISLKHKNDIKDVFGGEAEVKFSLRSTFPQSTQASIDRITTAREEKGFIQRITEAIAPTAFSKYRQQYLNRYNQLGKYDKLLADQLGVPGLLADASSEAAALLSDNGAGLTASALGVHDRVGGIPVFRNGVTIISNVNNTVGGPMKIFAKLTELGKGDPYIYQTYQQWAGAKRASRFTANGIDTPYTAADLQEAKNIEARYPEFVNIQKDYIKFNDGLVQYMLDTGIIDKEGAKKFSEHADYIPFYRQLDGEATIGPNIFQSISGVKQPRKIKGGEAPLADFMETIVRNTQSIIQAGVKNTAAQRAVKVAMQLGPNFIEPLNYASSLPSDIMILENGLKKYYRSSDSLWIESLKALNAADLPFNALISGPANLLRTMVTKDPGFMLANMMRDSLAAHVTSGIKMTPIVDTIKNFGAAIAGQSPEFQKLLNAGILGGYDFSQNIEYSGKVLSKELRKKTGTTTTTEKVLSPFTGLWSALEKGTTASDAATRIEVYKKTLAATNNEAEALFRALEVMNFNRKGSSPVIRVITAAIPFLNARIQGLDVLYRAAFGEINSANAEQIQKSFFIRGAQMMALSAMYWALTHDDEEYKKQEAENRDNYWLLPSLGIKIPIPFEVGILFKVIPERILAYSFGDDTGQDFMKSMARQLWSTLAFNPIPQTALPLVEAVTNYSFFTQRPIVGQGMEGVAPGYQVGPGTTNIAADIGKALNISPMKLDHMIKGYTGTMGMYMLEVVDSVYSMNSDIEKPSKRLDQMPVLKRFLIDPEARGTVTAYYEMKNAASEAVRTSNLLERTFKFNDQMEYMQENGKMLVADEYVKTLEKTMKKFREMRGMIQSSNMSGDEKRDAIKQITAAENKLTSNIQAMKKALQ